MLFRSALRWVVQHDVPLSTTATSAAHLDEDAVLRMVRERFASARKVYTYCGITLLAVNPYAQLDIYSPAVIGRYSGRQAGFLVPPPKGKSWLLGLTSLSGV